MTTNIGATDRLIRLFLALAVVVVAWLMGLSSSVGTILLVVAAMLAVTAVVRFCPLYRLFGLSSRS